MLTPEEIEGYPMDMIQIMSSLEYRVMKDIVVRIEEAGQITRTADYELYKFKNIRKFGKSIKKILQEELELSNIEIDRLFDEVIENGYSNDSEMYEVFKKEGVDFIPYKDNKPLQQYVEAIKRQTKGEMKNITNTLAIAKKENGQTIYQNINKYFVDKLDKAINEIETGTFDYNSSINNLITEMTNSGLRSISEETGQQEDELFIHYQSGKKSRIDVATRRAIVTTINQINNKISDMNAEKLKTEYFEVTAHLGARPTHQVWQGKVYSREDLKKICGLGDITGLEGINCRHSYYPFVPGISQRTYTDEELEEMAKKDNEIREWNGKEYTGYEATQKQREMERNMRATRMKIKLLRDANASEEDIITNQAKYRIMSDEYAKFSKAMGLVEQRERVTYDGLK